MRLWPASWRRKTDVQRYVLPSWIQEYSNGQAPYLGTQGYTTTYGQERAEPIGDDFVSYAMHGLMGNATIAAVERVRISVFSEARFQFQQIRGGRPGALFGTADLEALERPWTGGTTGDLLARMIIDADAAGNSFWVILDGEMVRLRPDWVEIVVGQRYDEDGAKVGLRKLGYFYYEDGKQNGITAKPAVFLADEVVHFAPNPDPLASFRGMSWMTPVIREVQADTMATRHKLKFFENGATVNLAVSLKDSLKDITVDQFKAFVEAMDEQHKGIENAYKTLYTASGADVTVIGADMKQLDFRATQGAGETRIAANGGIHPVVVGLSEGMQGSSLNAGNYTAARRSTADITFHPLWRNVAGSLEVLVPPPAGSRLWVDTRDIAFLREDEKDAAEIQQILAATIRQLVDAGYEPDSVIAAVQADDRSLLVHSGLYSVQLQPPMSAQQAAAQTPANPPVTQAVNGSKEA